MPRVKAQLVLTTSLQTIRTVPAGFNLKRAFLNAVNLTAAAHALEIHAVESGGATSDATKIIDMKVAANPLGAGEVDQWLLPLLHLKEGATIQAKADAASAVRLGAGLLEVTNNDDFVTTDGVLLGAGETTLLSAVAPQRQLTAVHLIICNIGSVAGDETGLDIHFVDSGGSTGDLTKELSTRVSFSALEAGQTQEYYFERHLGPSGFVVAEPTQADKLAVRLGGLQELIT